jgi:hypothetical protein
MFIGKLIERNYLEEMCVDCTNKVKLKAMECDGVDVLQCFRIEQMISCCGKAISGCYKKGRISLYLIYC